MNESSQSHKPATLKRITAASLIWWILAAAVALHVILMPAPGWERDLYWHDVWIRTSLEHGIVELHEKVWCDYPPGYLYFLNGLGRAWTALLGDLPPENSVSMLYILKFWAVLSNIAGAYILYRLAKKHFNRKRGLLIAALLAFNPALIFNSAVWGQVDSLQGLLVIIACMLVCARRTALGFGVLSLVILIKFQAVVVLPALVMTTFHLNKGQGIKKAYIGTALSSLIILLPFYLANKTDWVIQTAFGASGRYPKISMNAWNIWWLVGGKESVFTSDAYRIGNGLLSYYGTGMLLFVLMTVLILIQLRHRLKKEHVRPESALFTACALEFMAFYLFPTQMHERYIVPCLFPLAASMIYRPRRIWLYALWSVGIAHSLASTLRVSYPHGLGLIGDVLEKADLINTVFPKNRVDAYVGSILFILLFFLTFIFVKKIRFNLKLLIPVALFPLLVGGISAIPMKGSTLLSEWTPVYASQDWGSLQINKTVLGKRLNAVGFIFRRGIGTHAVSVLKYHLNGAFKEFDVCYAKTHYRKTNVVFRISADFPDEQAGLKRKILHDSGIINRQKTPVHVRVPVKNAEFLILQVTDGGDTINSDHAAWLEPLLIR